MEKMERKVSSSSQSQPPPIPCQRSHNFFDLGNPLPAHNYSHLTYYSYLQVNSGKPVYNQRFQNAVKSGSKEGPKSAEYSAPNIPSERAPKNSSTKTLLYELCAAYKWKPPSFDCHKEEGPSHLKRFIFKVLLEIKAENSALVVEAFGEPKLSKKSAAEHAAEGALWYLKHLGYFPKKK